MCGIAGILGLPPEVANEAGSRMRAAMHHRGPDDSGLVELPDPAGRTHPAVLLHTRLAILDLSRAGHQPMSDTPPSDDIAPNWIVYNGEIYNYRELRAELRDEGWPCRTRCDTETVLNAYRVWGERCAERFRGMFAWCLLDSRRGRAWLCRDRLGIKPLYTFRPAAGGLLFASELRTLLAAGPELVPPVIHPTALESFLAQGAVCGAASLIEGVELLGPGESLWTDWSGEPIGRRTWWQIPFGPADESGPCDSRTRTREVARLADTLRDAVRLRLISDVPLGLFLSGGIDSGAIATVASEVAGARVETISIGFDQPEFDETGVAAEVASQLGTSHRCVRLTGQDVLEGLDDALAAVDQPTVDGFNVYFVSRAARQSGLEVALSGLGGDELFGGYATFHDVPRALAWRRRLSWLKPAHFPMSRLLAGYGTRAGAKAALMLTRTATPHQMYFLRRELFFPGERRQLCALPTASDSAAGVPQAMVADLVHQARDLDPFNQVSLFEMGSY
ncbi:MAG: asparagine synthase (glutamine-hydrolyzing), partial [Planctomycetes bacterium]|nr:asparagine synthase (glutamine-hydrolyzing) [Planctomycetota bacterium]